MTIKGGVNPDAWQPVRSLAVNKLNVPLEDVQHPVVWSKHLDTVGDGSGTYNAVGNYSDAGAGATEFKLITVNEVEVHRLLVTLEDTFGMEADTYGTGSALTNGINVEYRDKDDVLVERFTDTNPVKTNANWAEYCHDVDVKSWRTGGAGNELLTVRWTFTRMGAPIHLFHGEELVLTLNDNMSGLILQHFVAQGTGLVRG